MSGYGHITTIPLAIERIRFLEGKIVNIEQILKKMHKELEAVRIRRTQMDQINAWIEEAKAEAYR